jgi:uncharacterized membrane protein YgdD (TMEM256/DUF423 family)
MLAALGGLLSVGFGAFAAHGIADPEARDWLHTGSLYGFVHVLATFACVILTVMGVRGARLVPAFFLGGVLLFSGSLYAMALGAPRWLGAITPIGGLLFMIGWASLGWAARNLGKPQA